MSQDSLWNRAGHTLEHCFDALAGGLRARLARGLTVQVQPYIGYGTEDRLFLQGRVLRKRGAPTTPRPDRWDNIVATYRRFDYLEIPRAPVPATVGKSTVEATADDEGFFTCELPNPDGTAPWVNVTYRSLAPTTGATADIPGPVLIPPPSAAFGIISDIDDTVVVSHATDLLRMGKTVFPPECARTTGFSRRGGALPRVE